MQPCRCFSLGCAGKTRSIILGSLEGITGWEAEGRYKPRCCKGAYASGFMSSIFPSPQAQPQAAMRVLRTSLQHKMPATWAVEGAFGMHCLWCVQELLSRFLSLNKHHRHHHHRHHRHHLPHPKRDVIVEGRVVGRRYEHALPRFANQPEQGIQDGRSAALHSQVAGVNAHTLVWQRRRISPSRRDGKRTTLHRRSITWQRRYAT